MKIINKMGSIGSWCALFLLLSVQGHSEIHSMRHSLRKALLHNHQKEIINDSDLTSGLPQLNQWPDSTVLTPSEVVQSAQQNPKSIQVKFLWRKAGTLTPLTQLPIIVNKKDTYSTDANGFVSLPKGCDQSGILSAESKLQTSYFQIKSGSFGGGVYTIQYQLPCNSDLTLFFDSEKPEGQATGIWRIATLAYNKLKEQVSLDFWKSTVTFSWPSNADFYNFNTVHLTRGDYWDVVGHEFGHALYDQASIGGMQGGQHKIDECYGGTLALSEGWASYFSAWLSVNLADPDAKFEYLVPRRAPIRFENIPADVCAGENNEWRVTGFFWDIIDLHQDPEQMNSTFQRVWNALLGQNISITSQALPLFKAAGFSEEELNKVWTQNFLQSPPSF